MREMRSEPIVLLQNDAVWLACAIDTEGTICLWKRKGTRDLRGKMRNFAWVLTVNVVNTNLDFVNHAAHITEQKTMRFEWKANSEHKLKRFIQEWPYHRLMWLLPQLLPYFIIKRKQAEMAMEAITLLERLHHLKLGRRKDQQKNEAVAEERRMIDTRLEQLAVTMSALNHRSSIRRPVSRDFT